MTYVHIKIYIPTLLCPRVPCFMWVLTCRVYAPRHVLMYIIQNNIIKHNIMRYARKRGEGEGNDHTCECCQILATRIRPAHAPPSATHPWHHSSQLLTTNNATQDHIFTFFHCLKYSWQGPLPTKIDTNQCSQRTAGLSSHYMQLDIWSKINKTLIRRRYERPNSVSEIVYLFHLHSFCIYGHFHMYWLTAVSNMSKGPHL